jgi:signal transduction histidine kinase
MVPTGPDGHRGRTLPSRGRPSGSRGTHGRWQLANGIVALAYASISLHILRGSSARGRAAVFEDLAERRGQALDIHDQVVQQLATAKLAIELGETEQGLRPLERGLESSRRLVSALVGDEVASTAQMDPGGLRRTGS